MKQLKWLACFLISSFLSYHPYSPQFFCPVLKDAYSEKLQNLLELLLSSLSLRAPVFLIKMVQLLQAVALPATPSITMMNNTFSREHTYRMAESSTWKVSLFKASINTPNDIPRQNLQQY